MGTTLSAYDRRTFAPLVPINTRAVTWKTRLNPPDPSVAMSFSEGGTTLSLGLTRAGDVFEWDAPAPFDGYPYRAGYLKTHLEKHGHR